MSISHDSISSKPHISQSMPATAASENYAGRSLIDYLWISSYLVMITKCLIQIQIIHTKEV